MTDTPRPTDPLRAVLEEAFDAERATSAGNAWNRDSREFVISRTLAALASPAPAGMDPDARRSLVDQYGERAVMDMEAALASSPAPAGLDEERLAVARHATWPDCIEGVAWQQCGAVNHRADAEQLAAAYATRPAEPVPTNFGEQSLSLDNNETHHAIHRASQRG